MRRCGVGWVVGVLVYFVAGTARGASSPGYRLPDSVAPTNYILDMVTHLEEPDFSFNGKVWIKIKCFKQTNTIILHATNLTIDEEKVTVKEIVSDNEVSQLNVLHTKYVPDNEFFLLKVDRMLKPGRMYILLLPFSGVLTEGLDGYYRSQYFDKSANATKWLAVTQFEPTDARKAFPCFDEPAMKATFKINLGHRDSLKAASNMPLINTKPMEEMEGWVWDEFEDTVPMSTYLVSFMVSEFENREAPMTSNNVTMRIWARKDAIDQVEFARSVGPKVLEYYEEYFDVPYPLPKQDMAAIPDFGAGAMENWGLITYRETALLFDKKTSSSVNQYSITSVIAHELAHQWFGNLVTMKWWTDLWLNEGFATYVGAIGVHHVFPEWNSLDATSLDNILTVFTTDALKSSHPVSIPIGKTSEISQIFDSISYKKGSALLRMMNLFLGESVFKTGVSNYLKKHKYGNAEQDDLWASLSDQWHEEGASMGLSVKEIMDTWTIQTGYPQITVIRDYEKDTATITQSRFLQVRPEVKEAVDKTCWWVPITYTFQKNPDFNNTKPKLWMNCAENKTIELTKLPKDEWIMFNINMAGLYRVQYDDTNWKMISKMMNSPNFVKIPSLDRSNLILNSLDFAWGGDMSYKMAINLVKYIKQEKAYIPWRTAYYSLNNIDRMLRRTPCYGHYKSFMQDMVVPIYNSFGKLTDVPKKFEEMKHHSIVMSWACRYGVGNCRSQALALFDSWKNKNDPDNNNPIPSDIKKIVYCLGIQMGNEEEWNFLWERYLASNVGNEKSVILGALGCSREVWILNRYLQWSLDEKSGIRKQDSLMVFSSVARQNLGFYIAKDFLFGKLKEIHDYYGPKASKIGRYLSVFADNIITDSELEQWTTFVNENKDLLKYARLASEQSLESALANTRWHSKHYDTIASILSL